MFEPCAALRNKHLAKSCILFGCAVGLRCLKTAFCWPAGNVRVHLRINRTPVETGAFPSLRWLRIEAAALQPHPRRGVAEFSYKSGESSRLIIGSLGRMHLWYPVPLLIASLRISAQTLSSALCWIFCLDRTQRCRRQLCRQGLGLGAASCRGFRALHRLHGR